MNVLATALSIGLASVCGAVAWMEATRHRRVAVALAELGIDERYVLVLALVKTAAVAGLLAGIVAPPVGLAAATGLAAYFVGAVHAHSRARHGLGRAAPAFVMLVSSLLLVLVELSR